MDGNAIVGGLQVHKARDLSNVLSYSKILIITNGC